MRSCAIWTMRKSKITWSALRLPFIKVSLAITYSASQSHALRRRQSQTGKKRLWELRTSMTSSLWGMVSFKCATNITKSMMRLTVTKLSQVRASIFTHTGLQRIEYPDDFTQKCKKKLSTNHSWTTCFGKMLRYLPARMIPSKLGKRRCDHTLSDQNLKVCQI